MSLINHDPCVSNEEVIRRLIEDQACLKALIAEGYPVRAVVSYHSETTLETHALPVFESDTLEDLSNRYADYFPKECEAFFTQVEAQRELLTRSNGFSDGGTMGFHCSIPQGLWVMIRERFPDEVSTSEGFRALTKRIIVLLPNLRIGVRYGRDRISV